MRPIDFFEEKKSYPCQKRVPPMLSMALSGLTDRKGNMLVSSQPSTDERVLRNLEAVLLIEPNRMKEVTLTRIGAQKYRSAEMRYS